MKTLLLVLCSTVLTGAASGQDASDPLRNGFWFSIGLGAGSAGADCPSCTSDRTTGGAGYIALGGTVSQKVLLGGESSAWVYSESGVDETLGFVSFVLQWYPSAEGHFFLKFGVGGAAYQATDGVDDLTATAPAGLFGLGFDARVGDNVSIVPFLTSFATSAVDFKINGISFPTAQSITLNLVQLGVAVTIH